MRIAFRCLVCADAYRLVELDLATINEIDIVPGQCKGCFDEQMERLRQLWIEAGHPLQAWEETITRDFSESALIKQPAL